MHRTKKQTQKLTLTKGNIKLQNRGLVTFGDVRQETMRGYSYNP